jgi:hypothetical protein
VSEMIETAQVIHPSLSDYFILYVKNTQVLSTSMDMQLFKT